MPWLCAGFPGEVSWLLRVGAQPTGAVSPWVGGVLVGFAIGTLLTAAVVTHLVRRYVRRVRAADARARRAERLAELGSMTRGLAHEIKNPLSTIGLNVQLLAEGVEDLPIDDESRAPLLRRLGSLGREAERLRGILTDFLEYADELRFEPRGADLNAAVDELIDFFLPQAEQQGVRVRSDLSPGELIAWCDPHLIKQAVLNLVLNAVQAMAGQPEGKPREMILRTNRSEDEQRRPTAVLHVIDTGPGIEADAAQRIFEPYFTTKSGGTGLGLSTARRIIEAHGGRIELHTEPGRGTDFQITLPGVAPLAEGPEA
ncbi:MAG: ATP-binding protein [Planctomycetota bacterium]|nr:ATP-binding protein [Planctomycetota bacterium]